MGGIKVTVLLLIELATPDAFRLFTITDIARIVQLQVPQVVPIATSHVDNLSQQT